MPLAAAASPGDDVKALLEQGKPAEAYQLGRSTPDQLGDPLFDFFFGISALDSGHAGEGVLALERYLLLFPDNRSARFHLARGYFILGEDQRARDEFENLRPDAADGEKIVVERYLDAIKARESRYTPSGSAWLEAGIGWDSNANAGVKNTDLGTLGVITTNSTALSAGDFFTGYGGGAQGTYPIAPGIALFGMASVDLRDYTKGQNNIFDQATLAGQGGVSVLKDKNLYRFLVGRSMLEVDNQRYLTTTSYGVDVQHQYDELNRFNVGMQSADLRYSNTMSVVQFGQNPVPSDNTLRNSTLVNVNGGWTRAMPALQMQPTFFLGGSYGRESNHGNVQGIPNDADTILQNSRTLYGLRGNVAFVPMPQWGASAGVTYQESRYKAPWAGTGSDNRRERYTALDASLSYYYTKNLTFRGELSVAQQVSNMPLFTFDRTVLAFKVRYDFK